MKIEENTLNELLWDTLVEEHLLNIYIYILL